MLGWDESNIPLRITEQHGRVLPERLAEPFPAESGEDSLLARPGAFSTLLARSVEIALF